MDLDGKTVVVVGLAQTGIACARFCAKRGARVTVVDVKSAAQLANQLEELGPIRTELGPFQLTTFLAAELIVMSPGVPHGSETRAALAAGIPVIAEIELAYRFIHPEARLLAITGTNGKSTTTALTGKLCEASGRPTFCGGNLGNMPMIDVVDHPANVAGGLIVVEVATFMLENCSTFRAHTGVLTNITEDHLDRFGTMERYAEIKGRIWDFQRPTDLAIANAADPWVMKETAGLPSRLYTFDSRPGAIADRGAFISSDRKEIVLRSDRPEERFPVDDLVIVGNHNLENAMCSYLAARDVGVSIEAVRAGARAYRPLPHRMELVGSIDGTQGANIYFYDDSKGTNVASVAASVRGFPRPLVLIAGGVDKGGSYVPLFEALEAGDGTTCKGIVLIGKAAPLIREAAGQFGVTYPLIDAADMHEAVARATALCTDGDAVVLSPACASYDMFQNFGHRGRVFREAVTAVGANRLD